LVMGVIYDKRQVEDKQSASNSARLTLKMKRGFEEEAEVRDSVWTFTLQYSTVP